MSAKWERSKRWDDAFFPAWAWPAKAVLRAFSSIPLAVVLLTLVSLFGVLASVPVGLLALAPTYAIYGLTVVAAVALGAGVPVLVARRLMRAKKGPVRFAVTLIGLVVLGAISVGLWYRLVWPPLHFDPVRGTGLKLFADFVEQYKSTTVRRLPGLEMSELEFYSWWPMRVLLLAFVANMVIATVRRIEFTFPNIGVLTVHTGIVVIALGSVYYNALKLEGDTILFAGTPGESGKPGVGPPQTSFYDNTEVALYVQQGIMTEQRALSGVPRYNEYNLQASAGRTATAAGGVRLDWLEGEPARVLDIPVRGPANGRVDPSLRIRVVGYAPYVDMERGVEDWLRVDPATLGPVDASTRLEPLRLVHLLSRVPGEDGTVPDGPVFAFNFLPRSPKDRMADNGVLSIEYTKGMDEGRWSALSARLPEGAERALVVEMPGRPGLPGGFRGVFRADAGARLTLGDTGYTIEVKEVHARSPMPIITEGYRGADSAVAVLRVTPAGGPGFDRWVYHRFPEIAQDLLDEKNERGMPARRDADPSIRVWLVDATQLHVFMDEREDGSVRALVRRPGEPPVVIDRVPADPADASRLLLSDVVPLVDLRLSERWEHAERFDRPRPVAVEQRENRFVGTHDKAMLAVELTSESAPGWSRVVWLPFAKYLELGPELRRTVTLPTGQRVHLVFGRRQYRLPDFELRLVDFEMVSYDHRGAPRDYRSLLRVSPVGKGRFEEFEHVTQLNAPLRAPFHWSPERAWVLNLFGRLASGLNPAQFKFSQAGWDAGGWEETQEQADAGLIPAPYARFTILGVGNNPGIHVIALGGVLMGVGIPWAFYVKPWIMQRRKKKIQDQLKSGAYRRPTGAVVVSAVRPAGPAPEPAAERDRTGVSP